MAVFGGRLSPKPATRNSAGSALIASIEGSGGNTCALGSMGWNRKPTAKRSPTDTTIRSATAILGVTTPFTQPTTMAAAPHAIAPLHSVASAMSRTNAACRNAGHCHQIKAPTRAVMIASPASAARIARS